MSRREGKKKKTKYRDIQSTFFTQKKNERFGGSSLLRRESFEKKKKTTKKTKKTKKTMTTTTSTKTPPPPAYDAVAAISSKTTTTTTTTTPDECAKTNRITKDDTADYDDVDSLASLTTRELHRIAISNGDRLGEGPKESTTGGGGGGGGAAAAGNFETNEGGVGLSEAEEKDAKIALCEVRNPKKIGQGNATTTTKKFTTTTTTVFLSSVKRHVLRASVFDFDATLCGLLLLLLLLTNNCVLLLLLLNRLNRVRGVYRQIGMYVSLVQQSERGSRTTIL